LCFIILFLLKKAVLRHRLSGLPNLQIDGRGFALLATFDIVANALAFAQVSKASSLHGTDVDEHIL